ncbi:MAG: hypothetical protein MZV70_12050 [Desulfobacterales bacterium]|nr:hypothetical protein [Desulfobacterales bacterium]
MNASSSRRRKAYVAGMAAALLTVFFPVRAISQPVASEPGKISGTGMWAELLQRVPFPYLIPLPEPKRTDLDGTYAKVVISKTERVHCLRCPDYAPEGGLWKLNVDRGFSHLSPGIRLEEHRHRHRRGGSHGAGQRPDLHRRHRRLQVEAGERAVDDRGDRRPVRHRAAGNEPHPAAVGLLPAAQRRGGGVRALAEARGVRLSHSRKHGACSRKSQLLMRVVQNVQAIARSPFP